MPTIKAKQKEDLMKVKDPTQAAPAAPPPAPPVAEQPKPAQSAPPPPPPPPPPPAPTAPPPPPAPVKVEATVVAALVPATPKTMAVAAPADLPDFLGDVIHSGEGVTPGFENVGTAGLGLPMLFIAQPQTPEVLAGKLKAGDIYLSTDAEKALIGQGKEFDFSIGFHHREWIEWADRNSGMGILNRSKNPKSDLAKKWAEAFAKRGGPKETRVIGDKTVKVDVFEYHVFFIAGEGERELVAMPLSRTAYKKGNMLINLAKKRIGCPIWTGKYTAKTVLETNQKGSWYNWDFKTSGWVAKEDRDFMEQMFKSSQAMYENVQLSFASADQAGPEGDPATDAAAGAETKGF